MSQIRAAITGVQGYVPDYVLTNDELATIVDTNDEWITSRTGIKERHILKGEGKGTSVMVVEALKGLLKKTNTNPDDVELVICATVTGDSIFPDTANVSAYRAGIKNAFGFDVSAACSGFLYALTVGAKFIEAGQHKKVIVVGADKMSSIIDYTDRTTCVIFGDGGGAVMLEPTTDGDGFIDYRHYGDGSGEEFLYLVAGGSRKPSTVDTLMAREHFVRQNGRPVFKAAVKGMSEVVTEVMQRNNLTAETVDWLVPHQANIRIIDTVSKMVNFPREKVMVTIHKYGNTTAGTLPLCLWDYESQLKKGDNLILTAFGGGFTWGALYLRWAYDGSTVGQ
ncbi:3-oxoacyl-[acyl-carrier-protein] synthase III [Neolewinella xylanilytica]|uniref:Beta-ketoacyl-[acyl-carrier-protein] synthase III n=1 Tax=Neolewinella xylanilytica TaxID=1514080 RepID=A0A2S6I0W4_9BACT|nr:beta-ketoacyl-ACP synthase III [Neolewinella xylanilytica]PPK84608.1 3-oxoacyl-[acyl-carrier-protein] synthase III [Neolewinella xylanilytica]